MPCIDKTRCPGEDYPFKRVWHLLIFGEPGNIPQHQMFVIPTSKPVGLVEWRTLHDVDSPKMRDALHELVFDGLERGTDRIHFAA
jgi:hypothetical protein